MEGQYPRTQLTIVIVDDDLHVLNVLARLFARQGYQVVTALDGKQALKSALEHRPCAVVTDMLMPEMTGAELCMRLKGREETQDTPVILMSGLPPQALPACGADAYIAKPFAVREIMRSVREMAAMVRPGREGGAVPNLGTPREIASPLCGGELPEDASRGA